MIDVVVLLQKRKKSHWHYVNVSDLMVKKVFSCFGFGLLVSVVGYVCIVFIHTLTSFILSYCG